MLSITAQFQKLRYTPSATKTCAVRQKIHENTLVLHEETRRRKLPDFTPVYEENVPKNLMKNKIFIRVKALMRTACKCHTVPAMQRNSMPSV